MTANDKREWRGLLLRDGDKWRGTLDDGYQWSLTLVASGCLGDTVLTAHVAREGWDAPPWFDDGLRMAMVDTPPLMRCRLPALIPGVGGELRPTLAEMGRIAFRVVSVSADAIALAGHG